MATSDLPYAPSENGKGMVWDGQRRNVVFVRGGANRNALCS